MPIKLLNAWKGKVIIDGVTYDTVDAIPNGFNLTPDTNIQLIGNPVAKATVEPVTEDAEWLITVKPYMTKKASPDFDFMKKWNNDIPMPFRTMVGKKIKETKGMIYMQLHCDIIYKRSTHCMCCGKVLTNPVSQYFGVGPECGGHNYTHPFDTDEQLKEAVESYRNILLNKTWEGWIIKSAIVTAEEHYAVHD